MANVSTGVFPPSHELLMITFIIAVLWLIAIEMELDAPFTSTHLVRRNLQKLFAVANEMSDVLNDWIHALFFVLGEFIES